MKLGIARGKVGGKSGRPALAHSNPAAREAPRIQVAARIGRRSQQSVQTADEALFS